MKDPDAVWSEIQSAISKSFAESFPDRTELLENLPRLLDLAKEVRLTDDRELRTLGLDFLHEASRDLRSCRVLHSKKIYPHAVYHLQQAVEKATKGYVLGFGWLNKQELAKTHDSPRLFMKALLEKPGIKSWAKHSGSERIKTIIDNAYLAVDDSERRKEVALTSYEDITVNLAEIHKFTVIGEQLSQSLIEKLSSIRGVKAQSSPPLYQAMSAMVTLFGLAAISFPHEAYTRYPDGGITPSQYTTNLGVVHAALEMAKLLEREIQRLIRLLSDQMKKGELG